LEDANNKLYKSHQELKAKLDRINEDMMTLKNYCIKGVCREISNYVLKVLLGTAGVSYNDRNATDLYSTTFFTGLEYNDQIKIMRVVSCLLEVKGLCSDAIHSPMFETEELNSFKLTPNKCKALLSSICFGSPIKEEGIDTIINLLKHLLSEHPKNKKIENKAEIEFNLQNTFTLKSLNSIFEDGVL
jgi:hypothetical protein